MKPNKEIILKLLVICLTDVNLFKIRMKINTVFKRNISQALNKVQLKNYFHTWMKIIVDISGLVLVLISMKKVISNVELNKNFSNLILKILQAGNVKLDSIMYYTKNIMTWLS